MLNIGKQGEHRERRLFREAHARPRLAICAAPPSAVGAFAGGRRADAALDGRLPGLAVGGRVLPGLPVALRLLPQSAPFAVKGSTQSLERRVGVSGATARKIGCRCVLGGRAARPARYRGGDSGGAELGFQVGLHTGGTSPGGCGSAPADDWVGLDIKARFAEYQRITAVRGSGDRARASATLLLGSGVDHEFRTTVHPHQHDLRGLGHLAKELGELGVRHYVMQEFRADGCADTTLVNNLPMSSLLTEPWCAAIAPSFTSFTVRRA